MITFREAYITDAHVVAKNLRTTDAHGFTAESLRVTIEASDVAHAGEVDGEVAALFGIIDESHGLERRGACWLATTEVMQRNALTFARLSRPVWAEMRQGWDQIRGCYPAAEKNAAIWLRSLGFEVGGDVHGHRLFLWRAS